MKFTPRHIAQRLIIMAALVLAAVSFPPGRTLAHRGERQPNPTAHPAAGIAAAPPTTLTAQAHGLVPKHPSGSDHAVNGNRLADATQARAVARQKQPAGGRESLAARASFDDTGGGGRAPDKNGSLALVENLFTDSRVTPPDDPTTTWGFAAAWKDTAAGQDRYVTGTRSRPGAPSHHERT